MIGARLQPQGNIRLSGLARSLGFTHAFNFGSGSAITSNIANGQQGFSNVTGATIQGGPGGRAVQFQGLSSNRLEVFGNPFATASCSYLWLESGIDNTSGGQSFTESKYNTDPASETGSLQIRMSGSNVLVLQSQTAVQLTGTGARDNTGKVNSGALSVAGNNGRHALFSAGRLIASTTPSSSYTHGISCLGGGSDCPSSTIKTYLLLFAPRPLPDSILQSLTRNPWVMFEDPTDEEDILFAAAAATANATLAWSEQNESMSLAAQAINRASLVWVEAGESMSVSSNVSNRGTISWSEQGETVAIVGMSQEPAAASISLSMAWTEASELSTVVARLVNRSALSYMEQGESWGLVVDPSRPPQPDPSPYPQLNLYAIIGSARINVKSAMRVTGINLLSKIL